MPYTDLPKDLRDNHAPAWVAIDRCLTAPPARASEATLRARVKPTVARTARSRPSEPGG